MQPIDEKDEWISGNDTKRHYYGHHWSLLVCATRG